MMHSDALADISKLRDSNRSKAVERVKAGRKEPAWSAYAIGGRRSSPLGRIGGEAERNVETPTSGAADFRTRISVSAPPQAWKQRHPS
jgi:hypothetical protein